MLPFFIRTLWLLPTRTPALRNGPIWALTITPEMPMLTANNWPNVIKSASRNGRNGTFCKEKYIL